MDKIISLLIAIVMLSYTGCMMIIAMARYAA